MVRKTPSCAAVSSIIKRLQQVDDDGLELWEPVFKAKFPLGRSDIAVAFSEWHLPLPALSWNSYTIESSSIR